MGELLQGGVTVLCCNEVGMGVGFSFICDVTTIRVKSVSVDWHLWKIAIFCDSKMLGQVWCIDGSIGADNVVVIVME